MQARLSDGAGTDSQRPTRKTPTAGLGALGRVELPAGAIEYRSVAMGPLLVFLHGIVANGDVWRNVVDELAGGYRCITGWPGCCPAPASS